MGLLDQVVGAMAGGQSGGNNALLETVMKMVSDPQIVNSWVSKGENLPISAEQIQSVLGGSSLGNIASQLGMNSEEASGSLASMLPQLIDSLTPNGEVPQGGDLMSQGMEMLKGKFFA